MTNFSMVPHLIMFFTCLVILNSIWWLKRQIVGVPHHECSPNNFWDGTMWKCGNLQKHAIFFLFGEDYQGLCQGPNAIANFLLCWHKWNIFSFSSPSCKVNFIQGMYPTSCMSLDNLCSSTSISITLGVSWTSTTNIKSLQKAHLECYLGKHLVPYLGYGIPKDC
jgi:hypothetical protein